MRYSAKELRNNDYNLLNRVERQSQVKQESIINENITRDFNKFGIGFTRKLKDEKPQKVKNEFKNNHTFFKDTITKLGVRTKKR